MTPHTRSLLVFRSLPLFRSLAVFLCPLLAACCSSGQQRTAQRLDQRLEALLAPDIAAHRAAVQSLPDGARVTLLDPSLFPDTEDTLDNRISDPRANVVEGLLDPSLMRIQVADTSTLPADQRDTRVRNVIEYFQVAGLGPSVEPGEAPRATPPGLAITITVQCPQPTASWTGYGTGASQPICD
jgi:hypothetical protein